MLKIRSWLLLSLSLCLTAPLWAQSGVIKGRVLNSKGKGIDQVRVEVKVEKRAAYTDAKGYFKLLVPAGKHLVDFSHINYKGGRELITVQDKAIVRVNP